MEHKKQEERQDEKPESITQLMIPKCGICAARVQAPGQACPACDRRYDADCWRYNGGCAILGCEGTPGLLEKIGEATADASIRDSSIDADAKNLLANINLFFGVVGIVEAMLGAPYTLPQIMLCSGLYAWLKIDERRLRRPHYETSQSFSKRDESLVELMEARPLQTLPPQRLYTHDGIPTEPWALARIAADLNTLRGNFRGGI